MIDLDWMDEGLCAEIGDWDLFFPEGRGSGQGRYAKKVCNGDPDAGREPCPVREECLTYAQTVKLPGPDGGSWMSGIWGGTDEKERYNLRNGRVKPCAECGEPYLGSQTRHAECGNKARARTARKLEAA